MSTTTVPVLDPTKLDWSNAASIVLKRPALLRPASPGEVLKGETARAGDFVNITTYRARTKNFHLMFKEEIEKHWHKDGEHKKGGLYLPNDPWYALPVKEVLRQAADILGQPGIKEVALKAPWPGHPGWVISNKRRPTLSGDQLASRYAIQCPVVLRPTNGDVQHIEKGVIAEPNLRMYQPAPAPAG